MLVSLPVVYIAPGYMVGVVMVTEGSQELSETRGVVWSGGTSPVTTLLSWTRPHSLGSGFGVMSMLCPCLVQKGRAHIKNNKKCVLICPAERVKCGGGDKSIGYLH